MKTIDAVHFVPLLIGSGRLARHLGHYFQQKQIPHWVWEHPHTPIPAELAKRSTHFWALVSDQALPGLCAALQSDYPEKPVLHSSAATRIQGAVTVHPLMTFGPDLYELSDYQNIPFTVIEDEIGSAPEVAAFLTHCLRQPLHSIPEADRARYHASAVMVSNLSMILWNAGLKHTALPRNAYGPILRRSLSNFLERGVDALTGPLARGDHATIQKNLEALEKTPESDLYRAFVRYFGKESP